MIDIVIPTLMKIDTSSLNYSLYQILSSLHVNKVVIIDNSGTGQFRKKISLTNDKLEVHELKSNIYVNPAWNLGVSKCISENILIMNDDIFCHNHVLTQVSEVMNDKNVGICSVDTINCSTTEEYVKNVAESSNIETNNVFGNKDNNKTGWFFCMRRKDWKPLPEDMKLWYGDDLIYRRIRKLGYSTKNITSTKIGHLVSATLHSMPDFHQIIATDGMLYHKRYFDEF
jgi:hypothetical protein